MKLCLLLMLVSSVARAETIVMKCENFVYRWTDKLLGSEASQIEISEKGKWRQLCIPGPHNVNGVTVAQTCDVGDKYLLQKLGDVTVGARTYRSWTFLDFAALKEKEHWREVLGIGGVDCSRLN